MRSARQLSPAASGEGLNRPPGGHIFSRREQKKKEDRIRRGMGWTTVDEGSEENIVEDEYELQSKSDRNAERAVQRGPHGA